jgi:TP901 family phage tail tape measure protein
MGLNSMGLGFLFTAKDLATGTMHKVASAYNKVEGATDQFAASSMAAMKQFGIGAAIFGVGVAGLAALGPAIEENTQLSKSIALVATEADLAVFPQEKMRDIAEKLATTYGKAPVDQAKALYKAVALGANDASKSLDFLNGVNLLAVAGNADLELSANALGGALNAYGASFDHATEYSDAFFTAMKTGNTTVQDLAASVGRVTSSAANMNISIQEILGAVSVMTNKGVQASEAVSGLKEALANVVHPTAQATAEAARLGIKFNQATLRAKGLQGFLQMISGSAKFNAESFSKLFTSVEGSNAIIQVASGGMAAYNATMDEMSRSAGATQKGFEIMSQTLDFQNQKFEANKKVALGMIGQVLEPMGAGLMRAANMVLEAFTKLPKPVIGFLVKVWAGVSAVLAFVGAAIAIKAAIALFAIGLKFAGVTLAGVLAALWPVVVAIGVLTAVFYGFKLAYEKNIGGFADFVDNVYKKGKLAFDALVQVFSQGGFSGAVMAELNKAENSGIKSFAIKIFLWVERIKSFFSGIATGFSAGIEAAKPAFEAFVGALEHLGEALGFIAKKGSAQDNLTSWQRWGAVGTAVGHAIAIAVEGIVYVLAMVTESIAAQIEFWTSVSDAGVSAWEGVKSAWGMVTGFFSSVGSAIAGAFSTAYNAVAGVVGSIVDVVMRIVRVVQLVEEIVGIVASAIGSKVAAFFAPYVAAITSAFDEAVSYLGGVADEIGAWAKEVGTVAIAPFVAAAALIVSVFSDAWGEVSGEATGAFDIITDAIDAVSSFITGVFSAAWDTLKSAAMPVLDAIAAAIQKVVDAFGAVGKFLGSVGSGISSAAHGALGALGVDTQVTQRVQQIQDVATGGPLGALPAASATASPGTVAASGQSAASTDMSATNGHLATIAAKVGQPPVVNVTVNKDGDVSVSGARGFQPAPTPT